MHFLKEPGDADSDGGTDLHHVARHGFHGFGVGNGSALVVKDVVSRSFGDVGERQKRQTDIAFAHVESVVPDVGGKVGVREHDALGRPRGSGGVDDAGQIIGLNGADLLLELRGLLLC